MSIYAEKTTSENFFHAHISSVRRAVVIVITRKLRRQVGMGRVDACSFPASSLPSSIPAHPSIGKGIRPI
jgi:hypothetical protein